MLLYKISTKSVGGTSAFARRKKVGSSLKPRQLCHESSQLHAHASASNRDNLHSGINRSCVVPSVAVVISCAQCVSFQGHSIATV